MTCGLDSDEAGKITGIGLRVSACAVGQAAAAIWAKSAAGTDLNGQNTCLVSLEDWLSGGHPPEWPGIQAIEPAISFPARHQAILLPWKAAIGALCKSRDAS